jgi:hypothetical protein
MVIAVFFRFIPAMNTCALTNTSAVKNMHVNAQPNRWTDCCHFDIAPEITNVYRRNRRGEIVLLERDLYLVSHLPIHGQDYVHESRTAQTQ